MVIEPKKETRFHPLRIISLAILVALLGILIYRSVRKEVVGKNVFSFDPPKEFYFDPSKKHIIFVFSDTKESEEKLIEVSNIQKSINETVDMTIIIEGGKYDRINIIYEEYSLTYPIIKDNGFIERIGTSAPSAIFLNKRGRIVEILKGEKIQKERILKAIEKASDIK